MYTKYFIFALVTNLSSEDLEVSSTNMDTDKGIIRL